MLFCPNVVLLYFHSPDYLPVVLTKSSCMLKRVTKAILCKTEQNKLRTDNVKLFVDEAFSSSQVHMGQWREQQVGGTVIEHFWWSSSWVCKAVSRVKLLIFWGWLSSLLASSEVWSSAVKCNWDMMWAKGRGFSIYASCFGMAFISI